MNDTRRNELQAWLRHELNHQTLARSHSSPGRVVWLIDQLENYVERWLGTPHTVGVVCNDLFQMIEIGAETLSAELTDHDQLEVPESWHHFLALTASLQAGNESVEAQQLASTLAVFRSEIQSKLAGVP